MSLRPYESFREWEMDMDRIRANPNDLHLIKHVRGRVYASPESIQRQVHEYLQDIQFVNNPIPYGQMLAEHTNKVLTVKSSQDPWFSV